MRSFVLNSLLDEEQILTKYQYQIRCIFMIKIKRKNLSKRGSKREREAMLASQL
jgi:hypothetical protein